ncbi:osmotically inducible protein C, partial [Pseudoalteromonas sp. S327]
SERDLANRNFSSNLQDVLAAAEHRRPYCEAPQLFIGHSFGGAAVLAAADHFPDVSAITTIGAPSDAQHDAHNFEAHLAEINSAGEAKVSLAVLEFPIKKQFLDDISKDHRS